MRRFAPWIFLLVVTLLLVLLYAHVARAQSGMMGVGRMMGPGGNAGSTPGGGFAILTESNSPITTESSSVLVTENAP